jgi:hypothetical protein
MGKGSIQNPTRLQCAGQFVKHDEYLKFRYVQQRGTTTQTIITLYIAQVIKRKNEILEQL